MTAVTQSKQEQFQEFDVGAVPLLNVFFERLRLKELIEKHVPALDKRQKVVPAICLLVLIRNLLISRLPLYDIPQWAKAFDPVLLGLPGPLAKHLNDDRIGRSLDALFRCDVDTLITAVVTHAVDEFDINTDQIHNDGTALSVEGNYPDATGETRFGRDTHRITYGHHKKDGRADMKQLLYILTTTADGFIPIWVNIDDGNTADVDTHIRTWNTLFKLLGTAAFLYVADSKLCADKNLTWIDQHGGKFLCVMPATWREHKAFHARLRQETIGWVDVTVMSEYVTDDSEDDHEGDSTDADESEEQPRDKSKGRGKRKRKHVYRGYEPLPGTPQGFRVLWFWSSRKAADDRKARDRRIERTEEELQALRKRIGIPYSRLTTKAAILEQAQKILAERKVEDLFKIDVISTKIEHTKKIGPGRKGPNSTYRIETEEKLSLQWQIDMAALQLASKSDGVFPLLTNDKKMSMLQALESYKQQPRLEKRFQQLKTVFNLRPILLHNHMRVEALSILYFLVLLVESLIEREARNRMGERGIKDLPIYGEGKKSRSPTAGCIFQVLERLRRYRVLDKDGCIVKKYYGTPTEAQSVVLELFDMTAEQYLTSGEAIA